MTTNDAITAISELDLDPIKFKLMHAESGEGWSQQKADAMEVEYRRFLYLMKVFPDDETAPTVDVDTFWHYHILDTMKYARDCEHAFGYFLHHYPYVGMGGGADDAQQREDSAKRMRDLYESTFGETYGARSAAWCTRTATPQSNAAWCTRATAPEEKAAWCTRTNAEAARAAWCTRTATPEANAAWCTRATTDEAKAAWCTRVSTDGAKAAWCTRVSTDGANAAWCTRTSADAVKSAWCTRTNGKGVDAAWCTRAPARAASAWCTRTSAPAPAAWCTKAMPAAVQSAWCTRVAGEPVVIAAATVELLQALSNSVMQGGAQRVQANAG